MLLITNIITKKTRYFIIFLLSILYKLIYGIKLNQNQLFIYLSSNKLLFVLNFLQYNSISFFNSLVDIVVVDNISLNLYRFEITYIFWNMIYEYRFGIKLFTDGFKFIYSLSNFYKSAFWLEREIFDMFGIKFLFNFGLRRILTDYGFRKSVV